MRIALASGRDYTARVLRTTESLMGMPVDFTPPFGHWLRQRRKSLDLTQEELGRRAHYSPETIRKVENGGLRPSRQIADALAEALDIPAQDRPTFVAFARGLDVCRRYTNLPTLTTSLVGREQDLLALTQLLAADDTHLLSLLGPPGVGKTRLAIELAHRAEPEFEHGAVFVPLASLRQPDQVAPAIAQALDLRTPPDQPALDVLRRLLRDKHLLLVLDNFEHLLDAAPVASELLATSPCLKVIATSRAPLRIIGEHTFDLHPLDVPNLQHLPAVSALCQYSAVDLFVQRAHATKPSFALTPTNAPAVVEICQRLDGLPLAIELAAVRTRAFTPQTMLAHLDHHIGASLGFLTAAPRNLPPRQQTLRHAIDWSYHLLNPDEQKLFRRLGTFSGGCTLPAAQAVCGGSMGDELVDDETARTTIADLLASLVDQSLVQEAESPQGESRYTMLETIHEYALGQLEASGEMRDIRHRFVQYYAQLALSVDPLGTEHSYSHMDLPALRRLQADYPNLLLAQSWRQSAFTDPLDRLRFLMSLAWYWIMRLRLAGQPGDIKTLQNQITEAWDQCETVPPKLLAAVFHRLGWLAYIRGDVQQTIRLNDLLMAHCRAHGTTAQVMFALYARGVMFCTQGRIDDAQDLFDEQEQLARQTGSAYDLAAALGMTGRIALVRNDLARAVTALTEALDAARRNGFDWTAAASGNVLTTLRDLGLTRIRQGEDALGVALLEEALDFSLHMQLPLAAATCELYLAYGDLCQNRADSAPARLDFCLRRYYGSHNESAVPGVLSILAQALHLQGHLTQAMTVAGAAAVHRDHLASFPVTDMLLQPDYLRILDQFRARRNDPALAAAWAEGQAMSLDQAVEYALSIAPA